MAGEGATFGGGSRAVCGERLASYAVNVGTKCGHDCTYCSTGTMLRMHPSFKDAGEKPFDLGYAIVDPSMPERVARDAKAIKPASRGLVELCTTTDAWAPEAQAHDVDDIVRSSVWPGGLCARKLHTTARMSLFVRRTLTGG